VGKEKSIFFKLKKYEFYNSYILKEYFYSFCNFHMEVDRRLQMRYLFLPLIVH